MRRVIVAPGLAVVILALAVAAGCQCSGGDGASADGGSTDTDADTDADTDTDTGTGSDTGPDPCPGEETDVALDPTLEWEAIPEGMECGVGCQQLTGTGGALSFDVWGDWVIVQEHAGQSSPYITLVDVETDARTVIDYGYQTIDMYLWYPSVHNYSYFYIGRVAPGHEFFYIWGTSENKGYKLLEPCTGALYELDAWGKWLAYTFDPGDSAGGQDLYLLDRETLDRKAVTDFGGVGDITLSGDWITFTKVGGNVEIYAYNVVTEELTNISDHPSDQFNSRNDGPRVVWTDLRSDPEADYYDQMTYGAADIYFYDIETEELRQITSGNGIQLYPDINDDWIVWQDWRECPDPDYPYQTSCPRIWGFNLATEEEHKLSSIGGEHARVWGDLVYFRSSYQDDPITGGIFAQEIYYDAGPDAGPDGGK